MPRPKIVRETRRRPVERAPPPRDSLAPHEWLSDESRAEYEKVLASGHPFELYVSRHAEATMRSHAQAEAPRRLEVMGFMLGDVCSWRGRAYATVRDVVTTDLDSTQSKVRFDRDALPKLFGGLDGTGFDYIIVGWYHSHPGHTCFMSRTDLETQRTMFDQPYHAALVIDPLNEDFKAFKLSGAGYEEVPFALTDALAPAGPARKKTRRLRAQSFSPRPP
ncbi:MAG: proteasome regulatory subunit [Candidatus Thermoplasmatota archaeon]|nr:proteasome regulatory subunit [Candidatus Thermoplasmatota archaeon]